MRSVMGILSPFRMVGIVLRMFILVGATVWAYWAWAVPVKVRDVVEVKGARENQLIGYGIVVGLPGTGDTVIGARSGTMFTVQSVVNMLKRFGIVVPPQYVRVRNVAAVMVTATLPPYLKSGNKVDVVVSSLGDARSLRLRDDDPRLEKLSPQFVLTGLEQLEGCIIA